MISSYDEHAADWGRTVRQTWKDIMARDFMAGAFMWTGFDYLGEPTPYTWPSVSSYFGMMDTCGYAKDAFYMAKAIFSGKPMCHVLPHWNHLPDYGFPVQQQQILFRLPLPLLLQWKHLRKEDSSAWKSG